MTTPDVRLIATSIHGRVLVRASTDGPAGLLLGFHGYRETAEVQLARLDTVPGAGRWTIASVQGLHRFYRGQSEDVVASWMTRQDRDEMIADNIRYVNAVVANVGRHTPIVCVGFSQGAAMAFRAAVRGDFRAAGVVSVGGDVPPELLADGSVRFPRVLLARGRSDPWLTAERFEADVAALRGRSGLLQPLVHDAAHEWTAEVSAAVGGFLDTLKSA